MSNYMDSIAVRSSRQDNKWFSVDKCFLHWYTHTKPRWWRTAMIFDLSLNEELLHGEDDNTIVAKKRLVITREELMKEYVKDETKFFNTLREIIYMFHFVNGYITQVSDYTMQSMYDEIMENPSYKGICYFAEEKEVLSKDCEYECLKSVSIDLIYLQ